MNRTALVTLAALGSLLAREARAQHDHTMAQDDKSMEAPRNRVHLGASAVPLYTSVDRTAEGQKLHEAALSQAVVHAHFQLPRQRAFASLMLNLEGKTIPHGELTTGAWGEGYVDRRHPHTYLHEAVIGASDSVAGVAWSLAGGHGFAPFGSDDPMSRPFAKYPVNHHLAQVLERTIAIGAVRWGHATLEAASFNGDEPIAPTSLPTLRRFGDSWAARVTARPARTLEFSASWARIASPEFRNPQGIFQWKSHASARWTDSRNYVLAEWARTHEGEPAREGYVFLTTLVEAQHCSRALNAAVRFESADRPEEQRTQPFRTQRPANDFSLVGITRWTTTALQLSHVVTGGLVTAVPFVEGALLHASPQAKGAFFVPAEYYGRDHMTMLTVGSRVALGAPHGRMGRYGVAQPPGTHEAMGNSRRCTE
ncbi:MAG: hypothetical protein JWO05_3766 [Gemmatimonadetes bacterium]|nr:hypothetical protein [Gemmatimonadota bacterium]